MSWTEAKFQEFKFQNEGDQLQGRILERYKAQYGLAYHLENSQGEKFYFFGSSQLDRELDGCVGRIVSITYRGTIETKSGRNMKDFDVKFWNADNGELPEGFKVTETT